MTAEHNRHPEDRFATAAREDASRRVPVFSGLLHQRIVGAVHSTKRAPSVARPVVAASWTFAAAAAVLIAIVLVPVYMHRRVGPSQPGAFVRSSRPHTDSEEVAFPAPPLNAALVTLGQGESAMEADLGPAHWAGLDHDARLAARYVLDPMSLPLTPNPRVR